MFNRKDFEQKLNDTLNLNHYVRRTSLIGQDPPVGCVKIICVITKDKLKKIEKDSLMTTLIPSRCTVNQLLKQAKKNVVGVKRKRSLLDVLLGRKKFDIAYEIK